MTAPKVWPRAIVARRIVHIDASSGFALLVRDRRRFHTAFVSALIPIVGDHRGRDDFHESATRSGSRQARGESHPLVGHSFKIGRGETCHLRPNSEQVSREHAEFSIVGELISVRDLGSRNGTSVNGKALTTEACQLKDRDLVQVGPLTFAVSILDVGVSSGKTPSPSSRPAAKPSVWMTSVPTTSIPGWSVRIRPSNADMPTAVYGGDTITISAFKDARLAPPKPATPPSASDDEYERQPDDAEESDEPFDQEDEDENYATKMPRDGRRGSGRVHRRI